LTKRFLSVILKTNKCFYLREGSISMPVSNIFLWIMLLLVAIIGFGLLRRYDQAEKEAIRKACEAIGKRPQRLSPRMTIGLPQNLNMNAEIIHDAKKNLNFFDIGCKCAIESEASVKLAPDVQYDWTSTVKAVGPVLRHGVQDKEMAAVASCHDCA
jgi:hypothetical protein